MTCDFCQQEKLDCQSRPLLRVTDEVGKRTANPFRGNLCDGCYDQALVFGTAGHDWVLNRIRELDSKSSQKGRRAV
jgi:hypothetical protein